MEYVMINIGTVEYKGERLAHLDKNRLIEILQELTKEVNAHPNNKAEYLFKKELLLNTKSVNIIRFIITMQSNLLGFNIHVNYDNHILLQENKTWKSYAIKFGKERYAVGNEVKYMYDIPRFYASDKKLIEAIKIDIIQAYSERTVFLYNEYMKNINGFMDKLINNEKLEVTFNINGIYISVLIKKLNLQQLDGTYKFIL